MDNCKTYEFIGIVIEGPKGCPTKLAVEFNTAIREPAGPVCDLLFEREAIPDSMAEAQNLTVGQRVSGTMECYDSPSGRDSRILSLNS